jgi:hypothetical protein
MTFDAKKTFTDYLPTPAKEFRAMAESTSFQIGVALSLAKLATSGATTEEMRGAEILVQIMGNIGEKAEPMPKFPVKTLATYEQDYKPGEKK